MSQSLAKEMRAVLKTLRENSPCKLSGGLGVRSSHVKAKRKYESGYKETIKKESFRSRTVK